PIDLYIATQYPSLINNTNHQSGYFHYNSVYQYYSNYPTNVFIMLSGNQNYTDMTVYACSDNPAEDIGKLAANMNVSRLEQPKVFSESMHSIKDDKHLPKISFEKINPTEYKVNVVGADSSYLLAFLEKYSDLWKVYDAKNHEISAQHVVVDGYANGWYVSKTGSYTLYIKFLPQQFFILGLWTTVISGIILLFIIVILVRLKMI
ncbi:MAG TPA: hypothetical protein VF820_05520, partial [Patescibacteria group bacterium]